MLVFKTLSANELEAIKCITQVGMALTKVILDENSLVTLLLPEYPLL